MFAAITGQLRVTQALLAANADVNASEFTGATALFFAFENGHLEVVRALLAAHANADVKNINGVTASGIAALRGHADVVQALGEAQALGSAMAKLRSTPTPADGTWSMRGSMAKAWRWWSIPARRP
jgi:ankyrin repeat protein